MGRGTYPVDMDKVKMLALDKGLSLRKIAEKAGLDYHTLINWNKGKEGHPQSITLVAAALDVRTTEIIKEI